jgi:hypothetical protein
MAEKSLPLYVAVEKLSLSVSQIHLLAQTAHCSLFTFNTDKTKYIIMSTFESYLKDRQYDPRTFPRLCKTLADLLKERVKSTGPKRFKIITNVSILENKEQCAVCASRCIWDTDNDNYVFSFVSIKRRRLVRFHSVCIFHCFHSSGDNFRSSFTPRK